MYDKELTNVARFKYKAIDKYRNPDGSVDTYIITMSRMKQKDPRLADADSYIFGKIGIDESNPLYDMSVTAFRNLIKESALSPVRKQDLLRMKSARHKNGHKHYFTFSTVDYGCEYSSLISQIMKSTEIVEGFIRFSRSIVMKDIYMAYNSVDDIVNAIKGEFDNVSTYTLSDSVNVTIHIDNKPPILIYILDYAGEISICIGGIETNILMMNTSTQEFIRTLKVLISIYN